MELEKLNKFIKERHYPINCLSKDLGMARQGLYLRLAGEREFKASELVLIAKVLRMTDNEILDVFFNK